MNPIYLLSAIIFYSTILLTSTDNQFSWSKERKLTWDDFKGKPDKLMQAAALTYTDISVNGSLIDGKITMEVKNFFDSKLSWSKNKNSASLLAHEQLHFDITELYTRKIRKELNAIASEKTIKDGTINKMSSKLLKEWKEFQLKYDNETNHGTIAEKQKEWEQRITLLLVE